MDWYYWRATGQRSSLNSRLFEKHKSQSADIALGALRATPVAERVVDFTTPFANVIGYSVVVTRSSPLVNARCGILVGWAIHASLQLLVRSRRHHRAQRHSVYRRRRRYSRGCKRT